VPSFWVLVISARSFTALIASSILVGGTKRKRGEIVKKLLITLIIAASCLSAEAKPAHTKHQHHIWAHIGHGAAEVGKAAVWVALFPVELVASFLGGTL
jgi:hypothetical protein